MWEVTQETAVVKIVEWDRVRTLHGRHMEDPVKEVAAMQYLCKDCSALNLPEILDVMSDEKNLYLFMPFYSSGELFDYVERDGRFSEPVARFWFRQILNVFRQIFCLAMSFHFLPIKPSLITSYFENLILFK